MSEEKVKEIQEFVDDFSQKLKKAENIYEDKIKKLKKNNSQKSLIRNNKRQYFPLITNNYKTNEKNRLTKSLSSINIIMNPPIWKPPNGYPNYFEEFKRLKNDNQLSDWQKVCKYYKYNFKLQERISLCKRSYEKEINLPQKKNFVCRKLFGHYINKYPNIKQSFDSSILNLDKDGKKIISNNIKDNEEKEKKLKEKDNFIFKYLHSKPPVEYNPWKFSNHIIKHFSIAPVDNVYSFSNEFKPKPKNMLKPFRRPKDYGDYFDTNI